MRKVQDVLDVTGTPRRRKPETGDTRWDGEAWLRWDGRRWTPAAYALHPELLKRPHGYRDGPELAVERRTQALEQVVADQVTSYGASVVHTTSTYVVLGHRRRVGQRLGPGGRSASVLTPQAARCHTRSTRGRAWWVPRWSVTRT